MVSFKSNDMRVLRLTKQEQSAILEFCNDLIEDSILELIYTATDGVVVLTKQQCKDLRTVVDGRMNQISDYDAIDALGKVFNKLSENPAIRQVATELEEKPFETLEEIQGFADNLMEKQNNTPAPEMGGLSPKQVSELIYTDWGTPECPLKLNRDLSYEDVKNTPLYHNTIVLLKALLDFKDAPTVTAKGNLNRKVVKTIIDDLLIEDEIFRITLKEYNKVINEQDAFYILNTRMICQWAKLIKKQRNKFTVTPKAQKLINPENAGKLYHELFLAYFGRNSKGAIRKSPKVSGEVETVAFSFYQASRLLKNDVKFEEVCTKLLLPCFIESYEQFHLMFPGHLPISHDITQHIINPFMYAGLIKCKHKDDGTRHLREIDTIKNSDLFQKYVKI